VCVGDAVVWSAADEDPSVGEAAKRSVRGFSMAALTLASRVKRATAKHNSRRIVNIKEWD